MNNTVDILTPTEPWENFAAAYLALRQKEWRTPHDALLANLPDVPASHPHAQTWKMRKYGMQALLAVLQKQAAPNASILDIGCGNGWLSNRIAALGYRVTAIDVNLAELQQAARVFGRPGLRFAFADVFTWQPETSFDVAIISSAIQYFQSPKKLLDRLFSAHPQLQTVLISDSPFYQQSEKNTAALRSQQYYTNMGYAGMAAHYHHHSLNDLGYAHSLAYRPLHPVLRNVVGGAPFPIITIPAAR